jgi:aspartyl-tRNA(Asn)/glutamyl-tRNA(Gln) amidotransferase subunit C
MTLSRDDVQKIASLVRLELNEDEIALYRDQLSAILAYAERLDQLDLTDIPPTSSALTLKNVLREDVAEPSLLLEDVLFNAAFQAENQFKIQAVFNDVA